MRYFVRIILFVGLLANCALFIVLYPAYLSREDGEQEVFSGAVIDTERAVSGLFLVSEVPREELQLSLSALPETDLIEAAPEVEIGIDSSAVFDQSAPESDRGGE